MCIREKVITSVVVLILFSPMFINDGYETDLFNDQKLVVDKSNRDYDVFDKAKQLLSNTPKAFTANHGQLENDEVLFYDQGGAVWFTADSVWFEVRDESSINSQQSTVHSPAFGLTTDDWRLMTNDYKRVILKQEFVGANPVRPVGREKLGWNNNYFYGNDSSKWCTNVPNYAEVWFENIYDGIDLRYYTNEKGLKYDLKVYPGADPEQIKIRYEGAENIRLDKSGNIMIKTQIRNINDCDLFIYQTELGIQNQLKGGFKIYNDNEYGFNIFNGYNDNEILVIDPQFNFNYSRLIGGSGVDSSNDIAIDPKGNAFVVGTTYSSDFNTTPDVHNEIYNGNGDVFVLGLDQSGEELLYSTYIGGNQYDYGYGIAVDIDSYTTIVGATKSLNFPTTPGVFDSTFNGDTDAYILKLNETGSRLEYSTLIGDGGIDQGVDIAIDIFDNVYITGNTDSTNFPTLIGSFDNTSNGFQDCFVSKFDRIGTTLLFSTLVGGNKFDFGNSIAVDTYGNTYVTGTTNSSNFPVTPGVVGQSYNGNEDVFVFKLDQNGSLFHYSTYIGNIGLDRGIEIAIDLDGNAFVAGMTDSPNFPTTPGAYDTTFNGGWMDLFVFQIKFDGSMLIFSTFLGGSDYEQWPALNYDLNDNLYITGETSSSDFPVTQDAFDKTLNGSEDIIITKLSTNGSKLVYSSYLGGNYYERPLGAVSDLVGNFYMVGQTGSTDFPNTTGPNFSGTVDGYVVKFTFPQNIHINSLTLLKNNTPTDQLYSKLCTYTIRVNITNPVTQSDLGKLRLTIDPNGSNIQLLWNRTSGRFSKINDLNDFITIEQSSSVIEELIFKTLCKRTIYFNLTFNWTYPDEDFQDVHAHASGSFLRTSWFNATQFYRVENDLVFNGTLSVKAGDNNILNKYELIQGNKCLTWSNLTTIYENTTELYPPADEFDITIWDEDENYWIDSPASGQPMNITTIIPNKTMGSFSYTVNLTGIPPDCDKTNCTFTIRIDADNVTFSNPWPEKDAWQKNSEVYTGVTITDYGGGLVDNTSIMHSISEDNGSTWSVWRSTDLVGESESITVHDLVTFEDGTDNFIKWRAKDSLGNGPVESEPYRILVDTQPIFFSKPIPLSTQESLIVEVEVGITISDNTSGVNASTIKYSITIDAGNYWSSWKTVDGYVKGSGESVDVKLNLTFPNGTSNRIRWRAYDVAGNGPTYSDEYTINVNIPKPPVIPEIALVSPANNSKMSTSSVELTWEVVKDHQPDISFNIKLGTTDPPVNIIEQNYTDTQLIINELENGQTYYWTVIPRLNNINGSCVSGIWSFTVDIPLPKAILKTPENNSVITSTLPTLVWSLEYEGTETVTYDIYFGPSNDPTLKHEKLITTYFAIDTQLEDITTYYWKVVPWAGNYEGFESEIWSFTVKIKDNEIPEFGLELVLNPEQIDIKPGEVRFVSAIVTNLGELTDNFTVSIGDINNTKLNAEVYRQNTMEIEPGKNKEFLIMVSVENRSMPGFENICIVAKSKLAERYKLEIHESKELTIRISEKDKPKDRDQPTSTFYFSIMVFVIILIIIFIIILILIRKKLSRKDGAQKENREYAPQKSVEDMTTPVSEPTEESRPVLERAQDESLEE